MANKEVKYRISTLAIFLVMVIALIVDLFTLIPVVGDFLGPIYWVLMSVYFWKAGLGAINWQKLAPRLVSLVAEFIPVVQAFPTIFVATAVIIAISRVEDETGTSLMPGKAVAGTKKPFNENGVRAAQNTRTSNSDPRPAVVNGSRQPLNTNTSNSLSRSSNFTVNMGSGTPSNSVSGNGFQMSQRGSTSSGNSSVGTSGEASVSTSGGSGSSGGGSSSGSGK